MERIRKGDVVARKSHGKDIIFYVKRLLKTKNKKIAILCGMFKRIEADSYIEDLEKVDRNTLREELQKEEQRFNKFVRHTDSVEENRMNKRFITGRILHLDGDKRYSKKSYNYYRRLGLNAVVKNIPEYNQPKEIYGLLKVYEPDILVVTGHDSMIKEEKNYNDIYNYRNSRYFIETVREARRYDIENNKSTVIFAGACQSYFEALIMAGADFASSPARIMIDFLDPLIVAEKVATTERYKYIRIEDIAKRLRDGKRGVGGIGSNGRMRVL